MRATQVATRSGAVVTGAPLRISHDGSSWAGSFQTLLRSLIEDMLSDGPWHMAFEVEADGDGNHFDRVDGVVVELAAGQPVEGTDYRPLVIVFEDGYRIEAEDVYAVEVS